MSKELENWKLERTVISQAHELTTLRDSSLTWIGKYHEAEKKYQAELEKSERYGGLICTIGQILADEELGFEEQTTTMQALVDQWEEQENHE